MTGMHIEILGANHQPNDAIRSQPGNAITREVLDVNEVGRMFGVTAKTVRKMDRLGGLPAPIKIGSRKKWRVNELRDWLAAGAPAREKWKSIKQKH